MLTQNTCTDSKNVKVLDLNENIYIDIDTLKNKADIQTNNIEEFATDIQKGLTSNLKTIPSKYFYDDRGSHLFQKIMNMPEYYVTDTELEILKENAFSLVQQFQDVAKKQPIRLIELGAGDGFKTKILIEEMQKQNIDYTYVPIDISSKAIYTLIERFADMDIPIYALIGDYFLSLDWLHKNDHDYFNIVLFLGSNIGNFDKPSAKSFLKHISSLLKPDDLLLLGFDLKKDVNILIQAYSDKQKITESFNLNLLQRINRELGANFNIDTFYHYATFNPVLGAMESYIISRIPQEVHVKYSNSHLIFDAQEPIFTEYSFKYSKLSIEEMCASSHCRIIKNYLDMNAYYINSLWQVNSLK